MITLTMITAVSIGLFMLVFRVTGIVPSARGAIAITQGALVTMRDPDIDEEERERAVQAAALRLVARTGSLILRSLLALGVAFLPVLAADWAGLSPRDVTLSFMARWDVILIATIVITLGYVVSLRVWSR